MTDRTSTPPKISEVVAPALALGFALGLGSAATVADEPAALVGAIGLYAVSMAAQLAWGLAKRKYLDQEPRDA